MPHHHNHFPQYPSDPNQWEDIDYTNNLPYHPPDDDSSETDSVCSTSTEGDRNEKPAAREGRRKGIPGAWGNSY